MRRVTTALLAVFAGCTFGSEGEPQGPGPADTEGDGSSGTSATAASSPATTQGGGDGDSDGGPADTTSGPGSGDAESTGAPVDGEGTLEISGGPTIDLGDLPVDALHAFEVTLDNVGDGPATAITGPMLPSPFTYAGGSYPGNGGTCTDMLAAGQSCTMALEVTPDRPGIGGTPLAVNYVGAQMAKSVSGDIVLVGLGSTGNLLLNPGAEDGASGQLPPEWTVGSGSDWQATSGSVDEGALSFYAGDPGTNDPVSLYQEVDIAGFAPTIDTLGMTVSFLSRARTESLINDPHNLRVIYFNAAHESVGSWESGSHDQTGWHSHDMAQGVPVGTTTLRVELQCDRDFGSNCNAWFDALQLYLSYPPS